MTDEMKQSCVVCCVSKKIHKENQIRNYGYGFFAPKKLL